MTEIGQGSSKSTITSGLTVSTSGSVAVGDYVSIGFSSDPNGATLTLSNTGTCTLGSWTVVEDFSNGSGTSGVRTYYARAAVTGAGTITGVTVSHGTGLAARSACVYKVTGADGTTPVLGHSHQGATFNPSTSGRDVTMHSFVGIENANATALSWGVPSNDATGGDYTAGAADATSRGTTGSSGASNISVGGKTETQTAANQTTGTTTPVQNTTGSSATTVSVLWAAPAAAAAGFTGWGIPVR